VRSDLPSGTVTFLFTDVEGSTKLLHSLGAEAYAEALAEHRRAIRAACAAEGGVEVDTQGDAFFFAFPTAPGALMAAAALTESLSPGPISVRVGLHTGTPLVTEEGYVGEDVHRAARIAAVGHGGQVLVASSTAALVQLDRLVDLGEHRFKDLAAPERVYQLGEQTFPPLKSLYRSNLPLAANPLIGRKKELADVRRTLLDGSRAVTITGPGGVGKTRFALAVAEEVGAAFPDGVWFVPLASLRDPTLVLPSVADAIGADGDVARHIGDGACLLFLDNFEQIVDAAPGLAALAGVCPRLRLLVTSREALRIALEREYPLSPLPESPSVELFRQRASAVAPELEIEYATAADICDRLDGLPLALELAAARCKSLSPGQILERLGQRLDLLKGGRDADPRQQTLRATIDWSYELLAPDEQKLFRRLSAFTGGCTLQAAERVCDADIDGLQSLVEKSLLRFSNERYWMLETVRAYAKERLEASEESSAIQRSQAEWAATLLEEAEPELERRDQRAWLERLSLEHENVRGALRWTTETGDATLALRLSASSGTFWWVRGHATEGRQWLDKSLALPGEESPALRARALDEGAHLAYRQGDNSQARSLADESVRLAQVHGDLGRLARTLRVLALVSAGERDSARFEALVRESAEAARASDDRWALMMALNNLGCIALEDHQGSEACELLGEAAELAQANGDERGEAFVLQNLAFAKLDGGDVRGARADLARSLVLAHHLQFLEVAAVDLTGAAAIASAQGEFTSAARLLGAAETLLEQIRVPLDVTEDSVRSETVQKLKSELGAGVFEDAFRAGRLLTLDEAVAIAFNVLDPA
jgi:predicted ATPase